MNRLALRIALAAAAGAALGAALAVGTGAFGTGAIGAVTPEGWAAALAVALAAGLGALAAGYAAGHAALARRLALARTTLRQARKRQFDGLGALERDHPRDELDEALHQAYRAGRALQHEIERLEQVENYRREFLGDVSHELRTPIFALAGFAESLLDGALDDDRVRRRFVEKILANAHRLEALTRDLTELSRIETGEQPMALGPFDLRLLAQETAEALEPRAAEAEVALAVRIPDGLPPVLGDRERLRQVLANLVENAVKYNEPGGQVELTARRQPDGAVRVAVVDDGIGIAEEHLPRLTERFYRVDKSRARAAGGTGLGLAIVKHILEAHGRRLVVESRPGHGSTFAFTLDAVARASGPASGRDAARGVRHAPARPPDG